MVDIISDRAGKFLVDLVLIELFLCPSTEVQHDIIETGNKLLKSYGIKLSQCSVREYESFTMMGKEVRIGYFSIGVSDRGEEDINPTINEGAYRVVIDEQEKIRVEYLGSQGKIVSEVVSNTFAHDDQSVRVFELKKMRMHNT